MAFCIWLLSLSIMFPRFICVIRWISIVFLFLYGFHRTDIDFLYPFISYCNFIIGFLEPWWLLESWGIWHHLGTCSKCQYSGLTQTRWIISPWRWGLANSFNKFFRWLWCLLVWEALVYLIMLLLEHFLGFSGCINSFGQSLVFWNIYPGSTFISC